MKTLDTLKMLAAVGTLMAGLLGLGGMVVSDLSNVKQSLDTVAARQAATPIELVGSAHDSAISSRK